MKKILLFAIVIALAGCAKDYSKIEKGTTTEDLVKEYGEPDDKVELFMGIEAWRYSDNLITVFGGRVNDVKLDYDSAEYVLEEAHKKKKEIQDAFDNPQKQFKGTENN